MAQGHLSVVPPYVEPRRRSLPAEVTRGARWVCFLILLAAFLLAVPVQNPGSRTLPDLVADIHAGRATSIAVQTTSNGQTAGGDNTTVRWKTSLFTWYEAKQGISRAELTRILTAAVPGSEPPPADIGTFQKHRIAVFNLSDSGVWQPLVLASAVLWLAVFIGMLTRGDHPYATRWAWFWLFVIGGVGPLLLLWKEPVPLRLRFWQRDDDHRWTQAPITGGTAFFYAIGWAVLIVLAGSGLSRLASA